MLVLPDNWESFYKEMIDRSKIYINNSYWGITEVQLALWLKNFKSNEEKFLSALIIYRLMYRNIKPRISMYKHIIQVILPTILEKHGLYNENSLEVFLKKIEVNPWDLPFKFSTIIGVDKKISKSGPQLLREFRREGFFHPDLEIAPDELPIKDPKIKALVLFDDFLGTGKQFKKFYKKIQDNVKNLLIIYCPLAAHSEGIAKLASIYPHIIVEPVELLNKNYHFFDKTYMPKLAENLDIEDLKKVYINMLTKTKLPKKDYFGYGNQALTYIFNFSSPNNSLPILTYYDIDILWEKLFSR